MDLSTSLDSVPLSTSNVNADNNLDDLLNEINKEAQQHQPPSYPIEQTPPQSMKDYKESFFKKYENLSSELQSNLNNRDIDIINEQINKLQQSQNTSLLSSVFNVLKIHFKLILIIVVSYVVLQHNYIQNLISSKINIHSTMGMNIVFGFIHALIIVIAKTQL